MIGRRKALVTVHVLGSVSSFGVTVVMLTLLLMATSTDNTAFVRTVVRVDERLLYTVAIPGLLLGLATGVLSALTSPWRLFRHTWVTKKLGLLLVALGSVLLLLRPWIAQLVGETTGGTLTGAELDGTKWLFATGLVAQLVILTLITLLSVAKPKGGRVGARPSRANRRRVRSGARPT
ncbi:MAG TPA: DUF2269 family protein [Pseudonocardiaceae bacterium]|nr:DUF2269 family protein [Pseudonocardiaceae bacterium]